MTEKIPDYWTELKVRDIKNGEMHKRIFAYWINSEYWRLSTEVKLIEYSEENIKATTKTGSVYVLYAPNKKITKEMRNQIEAWKFVKQDKYEVTY